jgi:hypothetical protein
MMGIVGRLAVSAWLIAALSASSNAQVLTSRSAATPPPARFAYFVAWDRSSSVSVTAEDGAKALAINDWCERLEDSSGKRGHFTPLGSRYLNTKIREFGLCHFNAEAFPTGTPWSRTPPAHQLFRDPMRCPGTARGPVADSECLLAVERHFGYR